MRTSDQLLYVKVSGAFFYPPPPSILSIEPKKNQYQVLYGLPSGLHQHI